MKKAVLKMIDVTKCNILRRFIISVLAKRKRRMAERNALCSTLRETLGSHKVARNSVWREASCAISISGALACCSRLHVMIFYGEA